MRRLLIAWALTGMLAGCRSAPSIDQRLRDHFQLADVKEVTPDAIRQSLLAKVPPGTSEVAIYEFLKQSNIGRDPFSAYYPADDEHRIFCHVDVDPSTYQPFGPKRKGYAIYFLLDYRNQLHDIHVQSWPGDKFETPPGPAVARRGPPPGPGAAGDPSVPYGMRR